MRVGIVVRNMGPQSTRETLLACARAVDTVPAIADLWVTDHIAIPPDDAEGSDGRYLDPLATLAYLAGATTRVGLGTSVLVLPYRPPLPTAKLVATVQELSGGRLLLGVGVGWMQPEFRALGVDVRRRGPLTDETLGFLETPGPPTIPDPLELPTEPGAPEPSDTECGRSGHSRRSTGWIRSLRRRSALLRSAP